MTILSIKGSHDRLAAWVACADYWFDNDNPLLQLNLQMLGHAEQPILLFEAQLAARSSDPLDIPRSILLTQCSALSVYWLFGLYEALRTLRERCPGRFTSVAELFREIEVARMPLAKHEVKSAPGFRQTRHYPTSVWDPVTGRVGWHVFDPYSDAMTTVVRTDVADRFLSVSSSPGVHL